MEKTARRVYAGCDKETDAGRCNKPVKLPAGGESGFIRCPDHPVKKLWPDDGPEMRQLVLIQVWSENRRDELEGH